MSLMGINQQNIFQDNIQTSISTAFTRYILKCIKQLLIWQKKHVFISILMFYKHRNTIMVNMLLSVI